LPIYKEYKYFLSQSIVTELSDIGLGSGIRKNSFRIPDPGVKKAPDRIRDIRLRLL